MLILLGFALLGICMGVFTGLIPGLHVNNITPVLVGLVAGSAIDVMSALSLIVAMMLTHTFLDYIPSTFLGVPDEDTALTVLPAHRLVLKGKGYEVIKLTALGSLGALVVSAALVGPTIPVLGPVYESLSPNMHLLLVVIVGIMIIIERSIVKILWATGIFFLSGLLGVIVLDSNIGGGDGALMPLLGGLFGLSVLLLSLNTEGNFPEQEISEEPLKIRDNSRPICAGATAGFVTGIIPGVGPAQGTVLTQIATRSGGPKDFLVGVSGVNTAKALLSFVALYAIGRPRSGAAVAVDKILEVGTSELLFLIGIALFVGGIATILHLQLGKIAAKHVQKLPYKAMVIAVMVSIVAFSIYYTGIWGILILITSTALGLLPAAVK
ncbi:MAG: tripartite tricarboxylate transporter permease, partial [Hadesarchaea archaeon]|nr:tripartite tricarboxylate transporter permease [Hadesarchaea archaeon]